MALTELVNNILKYKFRSAAQIKILLFFYFNEDENKEIELSYDEIMEKTNLSKGIVSNSIKYLIDNKILSVVKKYNACTPGKYLINYNFDRPKKIIKKKDYKDDFFYYNYILVQYYNTETNEYIKNNNINICEFFKSKKQIIDLAKKFICKTVLDMSEEKFKKIINYILIWCQNKNDMVTPKHINRLMHIMSQLIMINNYNFDLVKDVFLFYEFRTKEDMHIINILMKYKKFIKDRPEYLQGNFRKKLKRFIRLNLE